MVVLPRSDKTPKVEHPILKKPKLVAMVVDEEEVVGTVTIAVVVVAEVAGVEGAETAAVVFRLN